MRIDTTNDEPLKLDGNRLEEVESFTYLGGTGADVKARIGKARIVFFAAQKHLEF